MTTMVLGKSFDIDEHADWSYPCTYVCTGWLASRETAHLV